MWLVNRWQTVANGRETGAMTASTLNGVSTRRREMAEGETRQTWLVNSKANLGIETVPSPGQPGNRRRRRQNETVAFCGGAKLLSDDARKWRLTAGKHG